MTALFADTFFFLALINPRDHAHERARALSARPGTRFVTTEFIFLEVGDALCAPAVRPRSSALIRAIQQDPCFLVVPLSSSLLDAGLSLFQERPDKAWSLTDCTSFAVMKQMGIDSALTGDSHFQQAGYHALFR